MTFITLHSEKTYQGRAFDVRRDQVRLPNGNTAYLDIVEHIGAVTMMPLDDEGQVWFVRQYRHAAETHLLEFPAGTLEAGEPPEECARREIREEVGMATGSLVGDLLHCSRLFHRAHVRLPCHGLVPGPFGRG